MRKIRLLPPLLVVLLLSGCVQPGPEPTAVQTPPEETPAQALTRCRIVDGADTGELLLAGLDAGEIYTLSVKDLAVILDGADAGADVLRDGMAVSVGHEGGTLETWPAQFAEAKTVAADSASVDDRCGMYLQVLEDLWNASGNGEGLKYLGLDLTGLSHLTESEQHAVAWRFAQTHGLTPIEGTLQDLLDGGYLAELHPAAEADHPETVWPDGVLFTLTTDADAVWSLPALGPGEEPPELTAFDAKKWRGDNAQYMFNGCVGQKKEDGTWGYSVQSESIT